MCRDWRSRHTVHRTLDAVAVAATGAAACLPGSGLRHARAANDALFQKLTAGTDAAAIVGMRPDQVEMVEGAMKDMLE
jgi:hypothetical protein